METPKQTKSKKKTSSNNNQLSDKVTLVTPNTKGSIQNLKYAKLDNALNCLEENVCKLLIVWGETGMGKSERVKKFLKTESSQITIKTFTTALEFYRLLFEHRNKKYIILDDLDGIKDKKIISMLKAVCGKTRSCEYHTTDKKSLGKVTFPLPKGEVEVPSKFNIEAKLILLFNDTPPGFVAVRSRGITLELNFSFSEKIKIFEDLINDKATNEEGDQLIHPDILNYVKSHCNDLTPKVEIRTLETISKIIRKPTLIWEMVAEEEFKTNIEDTKLIQYLTDEKTVEQAKEKWCEEFKKDRRTFFRKKKKLLAKIDLIKNKKESFETVKVLEKEEDGMEIKSK
ncbi:hypothetical protein GOV12_06980 [Candidatus Pacearchaeota archaeon]|nr:hypothetical protein [Candidatus Pacearchaeota archaeon]